MALDKKQQLDKLLANSHYILVVFSHKQTIDSICGALAWKYFLEKKYKQVDIVCSGFAGYKNLNFLKDLDKIKPELTHLQKFTIKVDVSNTKIDSLSYDIKDGWLSIHLNPKQGTISKNELRTAQSSFKYDLIITINTPDLESLGEIFANNTDLFYRLPVINLDHNISNEHYGQINWVEITATSTCESVYKLMSKMDNSLIDEAIATALLAGIISQTRSFKTNNITPYTLRIASELMEQGADREKIVRHLYHSHSISSLKIWGQALRQLQSDNKIGLVWAIITRDDFIRSGASETELNAVAEELIINSPEAKVILLLYETQTQTAEQKIHGLVVADEQHDAKTLVQSLNPQGHKNKVSFIIENKTLREAEKEVLEIIREKLNSK